MFGHERDSLNEAHKYYKTKGISCIFLAYFPSLRGKNIGL